MQQRPHRFDHALRGALTAHEGAREVDGADFGPFRQRHFEKIATVIDSGIVDEEHRARRVRRQADRRPQAPTARIGKIEVAIGGAPAKRLKSPRQGAGLFASAIVGEGDIKAVGRQPKRGRPADARTGAGDDCDRAESQFFRPDLVARFLERARPEIAEQGLCQHAFRFLNP